MSRAQVIIDHASELLRFEERGIPTVAPVPSELVAEYQSDQAEILAGAMEEALARARSKSELATTPAGKTNPLAKTLLDIQAARTDHPDVAHGGELDRLEHQAKGLHHQARLATFVGAAEKAEFKGQLKKALDQYQEALFFLHNDDLDDELQIEEITAIQVKIDEITRKISG